MCTWFEFVQNWKSSVRSGAGGKPDGQQKSRTEQILFSNIYMDWSSSWNTESISFKQSLACVAKQRPGLKLVRVYLGSISYTFLCLCTLLEPTVKQKTLPRFKINFINLAFSAPR